MSRGGAWALGAVVAITFILGFASGYKTKELRLRYLKRRRDRLTDKLLATQKAINEQLDSSY